MNLSRTSVLALAAAVTLSAADDYKLSGPFAHENLTVYLIHGPSKAAKNLLTLEQAIDRRKVIVYETRDVNELVIENVSKEDVFIESGDIVKGGAQDRTLKDDLILPSKSGKVSMSAFCVEHGRWTQRGS
jgi:ARG and Rhodanese-Phosphatase-superfamily-associated Protein domain